MGRHGKALRRGLLMLLLASGMPAGAQSEDGIEVIAHPSVDESYLNREYLRSVFTLRVRTWPDGEPVRVFVMDDASAVHSLFSREVLGTFPYILRRTWDRTMFTGTGLVPERVDNLEEMRRRVLSTPGAVGYLPARQAEGSSTRFPLVAHKGEGS